MRQNWSVCKSNNQLSEEQMLDLAISALEWVKREILIPGVVENINYLVDFKGLSLFSFPFGKMKALSNVLIGNYKTKMFRLYIVNAPLSMTLLYSFLKSFDKNVQKKIYLTNKNEISEMWDHISKSQLENKFGGCCENIMTEFWPPRPTQPNVFTSKDDEAGYQ